MFQSRSIKSISGKKWKGKVRNIDLSPEVRKFYDNVQPLLEKIKEQAQYVRLETTSSENLHVTIRKYSRITFAVEKIKPQTFLSSFIHTNKQ